ncbi:hypothetical protein KM043_006893 [Ampulex compressa]|nr:hypothetical protein KM043_006893 [Ampulex compressa]
MSRSACKKNEGEIRATLENIGQADGPGASKAGDFSRGGQAVPRKGGRRSTGPFGRKRREEGRKSPGVNDFRLVKERRNPRNGRSVAIRRGGNARKAAASARARASRQRIRADNPPG